MAGELVYLREGHVCGFTAPIPEAIMDRWKRGHLQRVTEDGQTWPGDQFDLSFGGEPAPEGETGGDSGDVPVRPPGNGSQAKWADYAVQIGAADEATAVSLTRDQLIDLCTAPEDKPGDPE